MSETVAIFVPSLNRSHRLRALIKNCHEVTPEPHIFHFMVCQQDMASRVILEELGENYFTDLPTDYGSQHFPHRIQYLYEHTSEPWFLTASDDILFHPGWLTAAFSERSPEHKVITFRDLNNPNGTNFLVNREYIDTQSGCLDVPKHVYHPDYIHNFSDDELWGTAQMRGAFLRCSGIIEHLHWGPGKNTYDETYARADRANEADRALWASRRHLWGE